MQCARSIILIVGRRILGCQSRRIYHEKKTVIKGRAERKHKKRIFYVDHCRLVCSASLFYCLLTICKAEDLSLMLALSAIREER